MIYNVTNNFIAVNETAGTIQNSSYAYTVEVSNKPENDSGILLFPLNKFTFSGTKLYMRCVDGDARARIRVVPFLLDYGGAASISPATDDTQFAADDAVDDIINTAFSGGNVDTEPDADSVVQDMWNSPPVDTGDGFSDDIYAMFNP